MTSTVTTWLAIGLFLLSYVLIATEKIHRVAAALAGVAAMAVIGVVDAERAFYDHETGVDWNVIFLLFGMMIIVGVLKQTGIFEYLALWAAHASKGRPFRLLVLLILLSAGLAPILDNVTGVLLIAPVTLAVCRRLNLPSAPYLLALIFASNIGGTSTLIADPPNIIIASRAGLTFDDFLLHSLPLTVVLLVSLTFLLRLLFRRQLSGRMTRSFEDLHIRAAVKDKALLVKCLVVLALVMLAFSLHAVLHLDASIVAMLGAGAMVLVSRTRPDQFLEEVEWSTLAFFVALFVLVGSMVSVGAIGWLGERAAHALGGHELIAATALIFGSALFGAFVDNIPYTTAMAPIVSAMVEATERSGADSPLWWAFVFGADLAGNTTAIAAGANVVVLGIAARAGQPISFWRFTRHGIVVTLVTLAIAWFYVWLRYFVL